jgi:hypothetical protein
MERLDPPQTIMQRTKLIGIASSMPSPLDHSRSVNKTSALSDHLVRASPADPDVSDIALFLSASS